MKQNNAIIKISAFICGSLCLLLCLELGIRGIVAFVRHRQDIRNDKALLSSSAFKIMCIGESTTQGQYPEFMEQYLNEAGTDLEFRVIDCGIAAADTSAILGSLEDNLARYKPDLVVAMLGINDTEHMTSTHPPGWTRRLRTLRLLKWVLELNLLPRFSGLCANAWAGEPVEDSEEKNCLSLSRRYQQQGNAGEAMAVLMERVKNHPTRALYLRGGELAMSEGDFRKAETLLKAAITARPSCCADSSLCDTYLALARLSKLRLDERMREKYLGKALEAHPANLKACQHLAELYVMNERKEKAAKVLKECLNTAHESSPGLPGMLSELAGLTGDSEMLARARRLEARYSPATARNYAAVKSELFSRGIRLVAAQYPLRPLAQVKAMLNYDPQVIYVDNEASFRNAVNLNGYSSYFIDRFAGDFGHCTEQGNRLLAGNISKAILSDLKSEKRLPRKKENK